jgi:hypothetical protein
MLVSEVDEVESTNFRRFYFLSLDFRTVFFKLYF